MKKKVCIVTGSRAEYGLLRPLMEQIKADNSFTLQVVVTGMHLSKQFGLTYKEILKDGFKIDAKINIKLASDTSVGVSTSMGLAMIGFAKAYKKLNPDMVVVLGDRFEIFSATAAAHVAKIPVAHLHGGEITEGAFDDAFRHCISKMSYLHFTSTEDHKKRVIQLGESPDRVFNVGAIGLDNIKTIKLLSKEELEKELKFKFNKHNLLVTYHPVTLENDTAKGQFSALLEALDLLKDTNVIFTKANADTNGKVINKMIDEYVKKNPGRSIAFASMGQLRYLSAMSCVDAVVGNSSSGLIEAPSFKIGTVNIGDRQKGRTKAISVVDCSPNKEGIYNAINRVVNDEAFKDVLNTVVNPYGNGGTAVKIKDVLKAFNSSSLSLKKSFYDLRF
ncbi:MAG: UDP-N-acetylglucosamine 2-epimerase [bacterium]